MITPFVGHFVTFRDGPLEKLWEGGGRSTKKKFMQGKIRGGEWYLEKRGSRKILAGSRNLGSVFDKSRSLVFA